VRKERSPKSFKKPRGLGCKYKRLLKLWAEGIEEGQKGRWSKEEEGKVLREGNCLNWKKNCRLRRKDTKLRRQRKEKGALVIRKSFGGRGQREGSTACHYR